MNEETILINGANGIIGRSLIYHLCIENKDDNKYKFWLATQPDSFNNLKLFIDELEKTVPKINEKIKYIKVDVTSPGWGLTQNEREEIYNNVNYIFHLSSIRTDTPDAVKTNKRGIENTISLARRIQNLKGLIYVSSTGISGDYPGKFYEDWLDVGQSFDHELSHSFFIAERHLNSFSNIIPIIIFRIGFLVNDKEIPGMSPCCWAMLQNLIDLLYRIRYITRLFPLPHLTKSYIPLTPLSYFIPAMSYISLKTNIKSGSTLCLIDPHEILLEELIANIIEITNKKEPVMIHSSLLEYLSTPINRLGTTFWLISKFLGIDTPILGLLLRRNENDITNSLKILHDTNISCPPLQVYLKSQIKSRLLLTNEKKSDKLLNFQNEC